MLQGNAEVGHPNKPHQGFVYSVYNYKGGVWKTSTVINLGAILAMNHKVLLVDADTQCNLTSFFFSEEEEDGQDVNEQDVDPLPDPLPIDPNEPLISRVGSITVFSCDSHCHTE